MANIKLELTEPYNGQFVTFTAPCGCDSVDNGLVINDETYTLVDAKGNSKAGVANTWASGSKVAVVLDVTNKKAYIQNGIPTASDIGLSNVNNTSDKNKPVSTAQATAIADAKKAGTDAQANLDTHTANKSNPHGVTKSQVGLGSVPNVSTNNQTPTYTQATSLATLTSGEKLSVSMGKIMKAITDFISHKDAKNPHGTTASDVGARPSDWLPTPSDISAYKSRTITSIVDSFSATDVISNFMSIHNSMDRYEIVRNAYGSSSNMGKSILSKIKEDTGHTFNCYLEVQVVKNGTSYSRITVCPQYGGTSTQYGDYLTGREYSCTFYTSDNGTVGNLTPFVLTKGEPRLFYAPATWYPITELNNATPYSEATCGYWVCGKQVTVTMLLQKGVSLPDETDLNIFTLPSGFRPSRQISAPCYLAEDYHIKVEINPNGDINLNHYNPLTTAGALAFQISFFIE